MLFFILFLQEIQETGDFLIKPESKVARLDTSQWPLLLKVNVSCRICDLWAGFIKHEEMMKKFIHSLSFANTVSAACAIRFGLWRFLVTCPFFAGPVFCWSCIRRGRLLMLETKVAQTKKSGHL